MQLKNKKKKIMKNLKTKIVIIGISLLSFNIFAQDYVYNGIKNVDATIGINNSEGDSGQEIISSDCYDPANVGKRIQARGCADLLIVDNNSLRQMVLNDENYADTNIFTGQVTDMSYLFCEYSNSAKCTNKAPIYSISNWDVSNVIDMSFMFNRSDCKYFLNDWNVSNVTNMLHMFSYSTCNQQLNNWDVSNVTNMSYMFYNSSYNQELNNWNVSNVENMMLMFGESKYNKELNNWNVSNVSDMYRMFINSDYNQDISSWCVPNIPSKPVDFDKNSGFKNQNSLQPNWGCN